MLIFSTTGRRLFGVTKCFAECFLCFRAEGVHSGGLRRLTDALFLVVYQKKRFGLTSCSGSHCELKSWILIGQMLVKVNTQ